MNADSTTVADRMTVIRYFKHLPLIPASRKAEKMMGFSINMEDFLHTVKIGKQQSIRHRHKATQTEEEYFRPSSPSIFSPEFRNLRRY